MDILPSSSQDNIVAAIDNFLELSGIILEKKSFLDPRDQSIIPLAKTFNNYREVFNKTKDKTEDHVILFEKWFVKSRENILGDRDGRTWIVDVCLRYGENLGVNTNIRLEISKIFNVSLWIKERIHEKIALSPDESTEGIVYPEMFVLALYKIFSLLPDQEESKKIIDSMHILRRELSFEPPKEISAYIAELANGPPDITKLSETLQKVGLPASMPISGPMPPAPDFTKMVGKVLDSQAFRDKLGRVFECIKDNSNGTEIKIPSLINGLTKELTEPSFVESITTTLNKEEKKESAIIEEPDVEPDIEPEDSEKKT